MIAWEIKTLIKKILLIGFCVVILTGCGSKNIQQTPTTTVSGYPGPLGSGVTDENNTYPGPENNSQSPGSSTTQEYFIEGLVVPTPTSGKSVITGILLESGESSKPFITSIYLSTASPSETAGGQPTVNYSEQTDPIAVQDIKTGQFFFSDVVPGQYALVIWSQNGGIPLKDESGNTILVDVSSEELKDVGNIHVP